MIVEQAIFEALAADTGVTALVPAVRIKPPGDWQKLEMPYIVHFRVSGEGTHLYNGLAALKGWLYYQVSVFAPAFTDAMAIADAVRAAIGHATQTNGMQSFWVNDSVVDFDTDLKVQQVVMNFQVFEALSVDA